MLPRRRLLAGLAAWLPAAHAARAAMPGDASWAAAFIRKVGADIAAIVAAPASPAVRRQRLEQLIDRVVDVPGAARFCLGRYWRLASPPQQRAYVELFRAVLMRAVLGRINNEQQSGGQHADAALRVQVERPEPRPDGIEVPTLIQRRGIPDVTVTWVVNTDARDPRIIDVIAAGISLRITIRADHAAFLQRHNANVDALLQALRAQACDDCPPPSPVGGR